MKNKNIWYLGYIIAAISLLLFLILKLNEVAQVILVFVFSITLSVSYIKTTHNRMMEKDQEYRINNNDERLEKIKDKVNAMMCGVLMILMGVISIVCISMEYYIPAMLLGISIIISPLIMYFFNSYYEKKY